MMMPPKISDDIKALSRNLILVSATAICVSAYGATLNSGAFLPVQLGVAFPLSGALGWASGVLTAMLLVAVAREIAWQAEASRLSMLAWPKEAENILAVAHATPRTTVRITRSTLIAKVSLHYPQLIHSLDWALFIIQALLPMISGTTAVVFCWASMNLLFQPSTAESNSIAICEKQIAFQSGILAGGGKSMAIQKYEFETDKGAIEALVVHLNPDGKAGGLVASSATVPKSVVLPSSSLVCPGAVVKPGQIIPENTIVAPDGSLIPNKIHHISKIIYDDVEK